LKVVNSFERRLRRTDYAAEAEVSSEHLAAAPRHGMALVAHSPVARGRSALQRIGERHRKTAAQICLRWLVQQGVAAIPRTSKLERLSENIEIFDFELSEEEMQQISAMGSASGRLTDFGFAPKWD
jgi:diketogulonate reductase-like aldo/keto reductase